jgi:hypothetical protein
MRVASLLSKGRRHRVDVPNLKKKKKNLSARVCSDSGKEKKGHAPRTASVFAEGHRHKLVGCGIMTCGATPHDCGHREAFVNVNDAATGGVRGTERAVLGWGQVGCLVQNMPRPTTHHDLLEYVSSKKRDLRRGVERNKRCPEEPLAAGNRAFKRWR